MEEDSNNSWESFPGITTHSSWSSRPGSPGGAKSSGGQSVEIVSPALSFFHDQEELWHRRMMEDLEDPWTPDRRYEEIMGVPLDLSIPRPVITTNEPKCGVVPETLTPNFKDKDDLACYLAAARGQLPHDMPGFTSGVKHVAYSYMVSRDGSSWHCLECHGKRDSNRGAFFLASVHNVQPPGPDNSWDVICPIPGCANRVSTIKSAAECEECSTTLYLNQGPILYGGLPVAVGSKTLIPDF